MNTSDTKVNFSTRCDADSGSFKILELPKDLYDLIQQSLAASGNFNLSIKGTPGQDAVICTEEATYAMRSIVLSNSIAIATRDAYQLSVAPESEEIAIRDQVGEIIELTPVAPKLQQLFQSVRDHAYTGEEDDAEEQGQSAKLTYANALDSIQCSSTQLNRAMRDRHILILNGELRPIDPPHLESILELILTLVVSSTYPTNAIPVAELESTLADDHEIPRVISTQIMEWFGEINGLHWKMDVEKVVREIGISLLRPHLRDPTVKDSFLAEWKLKVGEVFEHHVSLSLLSGNFLLQNSTVNEEEIVYFPAHVLPAEPAARFADLFLSRSRWTGEEIAPFLTDIAVNSKELDKLLLKYARVVSTPQGITYTARVQYNS